MRLKNLEWKKFLLEKGERVALGVCVAVMVLMLVRSLFWPGQGFFIVSAKENAKKLTDQTEEARRRIRDSAPTEQELAQLTLIKDELLKSGDHVKVDPALFRPDRPLLVGMSAEDTKRRNPTILTPEEYRVTATTVQMRSYMFDKDKKQILVLPGGPSGTTPARDPTATAAGRQMMGREGEYSLQDISRGLSGLRRSGAYDQFRQEGMAGLGRQLPPRGLEVGMGLEGGRPTGESGNPFSTTGQPAGKPQWVAIEKIEKNEAALQSMHLAEDIFPLHMVIVVGSFPLKKQVERFQQALRLRSLEEVFMAPERSATDPKGQRIPVPQFQFTGLNVRRRVIGPDGKEGEWVDVDLKKMFAPLAVLCGSRWEDEEPDLAELMPLGLVMPRPYQARADQYPKIERQLTKVEATLKKLEEQAQRGLNLLPQPKSRFRIDEGFNPFDPFAETTPPPPDPETQRRQAELAQRPRVGEGGEFISDWAPPEYCVLRFMDVGVKPGETYEYQIQVRMANPNYQQKDVIYPDLAKDKELVSPWTLITDDQDRPLRIKVPSDSYFYAVDRPNDTGLHKHQTRIQFHRWLDYLPSGSVPFAVADWVVADQVPVYRGEYLRLRDEKTAPKVEVPIWMYTQENFTLATNHDPYARDKQKVPVPFEPGNGEYIVVDFQGGPTSYTRTAGEADEKRTASTISDKGPTELIYLSPEGKLMARDSETDKRDPERLQRVEHYKKRIEEIKTTRLKEVQMKLGTGGAGPGGEGRP
ncbi:MAG TPA: hypothetical protein VNK04_06530 [Gemmataceae bacterium]|nr:hypothetical protein [Gemmataceae bacterium]